MILAPNRIFLGFVAGVLPELGVLDVHQTTFPDFFMEEVGRKMKLTDPSEKLRAFIQGDPSDPTLRLRKWASGYKGSMAYKEKVDAYLDEVIEELMPREDLVLGKKDTIRTREEMKDWIRREYAHLPVYKRLDKIRKILGRELKAKTEEVLREAEQYYDGKIDRAFLKIRDPEKRRARVIHWMDRKETMLEKIRQSSQALLPRFMKQFKKKDVFSHYRDFMRDEARFRDLPKEKDTFLRRSTLELLIHKRIEIEDTAALLYLKHRLYGIPNKRKLKHVVIDEAQDFSVFQIYALKEAIGTRIFTILGDLAQGIHGYRGIRNWHDILEHVFPEDGCQFRTLEKSYRTTVEIMTLANQVLRRMESPDIFTARPVVRPGIPPSSVCSESPGR
ncbi:hypothetical protein C8P63_10616 [Melghirimyces profundicolus]|uniref:UvrD-like helicase ATP-binding domain-containing protein n=2 Tax=Melghirimyces profundicolus TaxID=1242148 RepID=A0A2T6C0B3_9BACL|nr:hypothetical protein C8P63_10616 [Melghirimyces profundicolus]